MTVTGILNSVANTSSTNEKKRILQETKSELFAEIFKHAYDPFITFGVCKLDTSGIAYADSTPDNWFDEVFEVLTKLSRRELTGNAARNAVYEALSKATLLDSITMVKILNKDLRIHCGTRVINSVYPDLLPDDFCMSAMKYDPKRITYPVYADTKLDGVRCTAKIDSDVKLFSRNNKEFKNYTTIANELSMLTELTGLTLDGEVTCGHFQDLMRTLGRKNGGIELGKDAIYNIFDVIRKDVSFETRQRLLQSIAQLILDLKLLHLRIVTGKLIVNEKELLEFYQSQLADGQEGIMIKTLDGLYELKRSYAWQKMKPELSEDLMIVNVIEGTGKYVGQLGAVDCVFRDIENAGIRVRVGSGFKDDERITLWNDRINLIGRMIEVKYQERTLDGSLRFPIFLRFRPDKQ